MTDQTVSPAGEQAVVDNAAGAATGHAATEQTQGTPPPLASADASDSPAGDFDGGAFPGDPGMQAPKPPPRGGMHYWSGVPESELGGYEQRAALLGLNATELGTQLESAYVPPEIGQKAMAWLGYAHKADVTKVKPFHHFRFSHFARFTAEDQPYLDYLGNTLHAAGATQKHVDALLTIYEKGQQKIAAQNMAAEIETQRRDREDAKKAEKVLREEWGGEYEITVKLLAQYMAGLSREERERIEKEEMPDGSLALNNPEKVKQLAKLARSGGKAAAGKSPAERIAEIKEYMRTNRSKYLRDERTQAEYRDLLRVHG